MGSRRDEVEGTMLGPRCSVDARQRGPSPSGPTPIQQRRSESRGVRGGKGGGGNKGKGPWRSVAGADLPWPVVRTRAYAVKWP